MTCWRQLRDWHQGGVRGEVAPASAGRVACRGHAGLVYSGDRQFPRAGAEGRPNRVRARSTAERRAPGTM
jgi:hypothetical protein